MSDLVTPPLPEGLCGIRNLTGRGQCVRTLGHLDRCSWDRGPAVDPRHYSHDGMPNLLRLDVEDPTRYITEHGDRYTYSQGCRCLACRLANAEYQREYRAARR